MDQLQRIPILSSWARGSDYWADLGAGSSLPNPVTKSKKKKGGKQPFPGLLHDVRTKVFQAIAAQHPHGPGREEGAVTASVSYVPPRSQGHRIPGCKW